MPDFEYESYLMAREGDPSDEAVVTLPAGYDAPFHAWFDGDAHYELVRRLDGEARGGRLVAFRNNVLDEEFDVFAPFGKRLSRLVFSDGTDASPVWCTNVSMFSGAGHVTDAARLNADMRARQEKADKRMRDSYWSCRPGAQQ